MLYLPPAYVESNPKTVQSLTNAFVRGLKWIASHPAEDIAKAMPAEYALGNMDLFVRSIRSSIPMYSPDGRFGRDGAETALKVLREFDASVRNAKIDLAATYTDAFLDKVASEIRIEISVASSMSTEPQIAIDKVAHVYRPPRGAPGAGA